MCWDSQIYIGVSVKHIDIALVGQWNPVTNALLRCDAGNNFRGDQIFFMEWFMQLSLSFLSRLFRNQQYFSAAKVIYDWGSARASGAVRPLTDVRYQACGELLLLETPRFAFVPSFTFTFVNLLSLSSISFQRYNAFAFCESIFPHFHEIAFNLGESFQSVVGALALSFQNWSHWATYLHFHLLS